MVFLNVPVIVSLLVACSLDYAVAEESKCITPTHYKEIGCTPIKTANESCPSSYNCDHLKDLADDKCHFRGKQLDDHQSPEALPPCVPYAFCTNGYFQPGHVDCGHTFRHAEEVCEDVKEGCCRHTVCGEELKKLHVCHADGNAHFQGEKWNPKEDKCMECVCDDKWSNATEVHKNANCKPYECFDDFWRIKEYKRGCAPMYYGSDRCCPSQTKCRKLKVSPIDH